ncbi:ThiF family adenylyltransferase [Pseudomonas sp. Fl4BN1]|uniref:ThiF family adenylyltransferase n=1 Tax=Pseudomonas sp. Fl4BN1 TaxID=2697651 RepID=UPI00273DA6CE|nr:ThiF family adenylyltransferase [Pseudomonas sp. Fl4BN1]
MPVEIRSGLTQKAACDMSGTSGILAGVGVLGSVLGDLWVLQGGHWTFVDPDRFLPHNLIRHKGFDAFVGQPKVNIVRDTAAAVFPDWDPPKAIATSVLAGGEEIASAMSSAGLVVDVTTTLEAPRELARRSDSPRTASLFVTPSGLLV